MFAFNYLLKRASANQKWLCVASETEIFNKYGEYVHGNARNVRKVVLSQDILDKGEITRLAVISPTRVLQEINMGCSYTKANQKHSMLFFFAHGKPRSYNIQLDPRNMGSDLNVDDIVQVLDPSVPTTSTTACCYSGGWAVNPALNATILAGASPRKEVRSWPQAESSRNRCGGTVFTSAIIKRLCDETSPLLEPNVESRISGLSIGTSLQLLTPTNPIQPHSPTRGQVSTYKALLNEINRVLRQNLSVSCKHEVHFSTQDGGWEQAWVKRIGFPLRNSQLRWDQLEDYYGQQYRDKMTKKTSYTDEDPENPDYSDFVFQLPDSESSDSGGTLPI